MGLDTVAHKAEQTSPNRSVCAHPPGGHREVELTPPTPPPHPPTTTTPKPIRHPTRRAAAALRGAFVLTWTGRGARFMKRSVRSPCAHPSSARMRTPELLNDSEQESCVWLDELATLKANPIVGFCAILH
ncbi:unnamed protein product [Mesocestoides corti]|uniref:Uncharacterized protein n=1 Tax=Mesocestoides corti TaxID=53468 RepID=A0A0R3UJ11_MESCO|nr:unnamed protein product [Mesocestoides corti]